MRKKTLMICKCSKGWGNPIGEMRHEKLKQIGI